MQIVIPNPPSGIQYNQAGHLVIDLSDQATINLIKAAYYQVTLIEEVQQGNHYD